MCVSVRVLVQACKKCVWVGPWSRGIEFVFFYSLSTIAKHILVTWRARPRKNQKAVKSINKSFLVSLRHISSQFVTMARGNSLVTATKERTTISTWWLSCLLFCEREISIKPCFGSDLRWCGFKLNTKLARLTL